MKTERKPITGWNGMNNVADPFTLDSSWLRRADNCIITGRGKLERTNGYVSRLACTSNTGGYVTEDFQRFYLVDDGTLYQLSTPTSRVALATGLAAAPMHFAEANGIVYYCNGVDFGMIDNTERSNWGIAPPASPTLSLGAGALDPGTYQVCCTLTDSRGRESGNGPVAAIVSTGAGILIVVPQVDDYLTNVYVTTANGDVYYRLARGAGATLSYAVGPDQLGVELPFLWANEPRGTLPAYFAGRMYVAEPFPSLDKTIIWRSPALHFHLFDTTDGFAVPGTVLMLASCAQALIVGTERAIYAIDSSGARVTLANYGVVPGYHATRLGSDLYFWSQRGMCQALPFVNRTETTISVAPGLAAGAAVVEQDGYKRYLVGLQVGGEAFNARTA